MLGRCRRWRAGLFLLGLLACDNYEDVAIKQDELAATRVGDGFEHQFEVSRKVDDAWFIDCRHSNERDNPKMEMSREGKLTFTPTAVGELELCIEYRRRDGRLDVYKPKVKVEHKKGDSPKELWASLATFRPKLKAVYDAATASPPKPSPCPADLPAGEAHAYEEAWLKSIATNAPGVMKKERNSGAFKPPGHDLWKAGEKAMNPRLKPRIADVQKAKYIVAVRIDQLDLPMVRPNKSFTMGRFSGHAQLVDVARAKLLCTFPLKFTSSDKVDFTKTVRTEADGRKTDTTPLAGMNAIFQDFQISGRVALSEALRKNAPGLKLAR
jgi:hypothetical protein